MRSSWRALIGVLMILGGIACLPLAVPASACRPASVTVSVRALAPFVMTQDNKRTGFTRRAVGGDRQTRGLVPRYIDAENVARAAEGRQRQSRRRGGRGDLDHGRARDVLRLLQPTLAAGLRILVPRHSAAPAEPGIANFLPLLFSKNMLLWLLGGLALA